MVPALSVEECNRLERLEGTIAAGIKTFIEVGRALAEIRDGHLYRQDHSTFESYCKARWQFTRQRAYQLIGAAEVAGTLDLECKPRVDIPAEKVLRLLAPLPKEKRREVFDKAVEVAAGGGREEVTVSDVAAARVQLGLPRTRRPSRTTSATAKAAIRPVRSNPEPEPSKAALRQAWEDGVEVGVQAALSAISVRDEHQRMVRDDYENMAQDIILHVRAELWATPEYRRDEIVRRVRSFASLAAEGLAPAPTDDCPAPDPPGVVESIEDGVPVLARARA